jgi:hypothetical protein
MATITSLKQLKAAGGIVSKEPVKRHIVWTSVDPATGDEAEFDADVFILKQGSGAMVEILDDKSKEQIAVLLSKSVYLAGEKGKLEPLGYEDAYQLDTPLRAALWAEVQKVAGIVRKNLPPSTSSIASSSQTESAAAP